jgi:signal transduction histidine kinase
MRERLEIIGGTLNIDSEPGGGTRVVMRVPIAVATAN